MLLISILTTIQTVTYAALKQNLFTGHLQLKSTLETPNHSFQPIAQRMVQCF